ncbi:MAG: hypothetical protein IH984_05310 [Planctomycetes bacterium]|nr:hypothetical protein [Planctomycetota bacterium]
MTPRHRGVKTPRHHGIEALRLTRLAGGLDPLRLEEALGTSGDGIVVPMESGSPLRFDIVA